MLIAQDFPYLILNKININQFFNVSLISNENENQSKQILRNEYSNLELILNDSRLHQFEQFTEEEPYRI